MSFIVNHQQKFTNLMFNLKNQEQLKKQANGGNSIIFSYPPDEEYLYIQKAKEIYHSKVEFIDISRLFVNFIDRGTWEEFRDYYKDFHRSSHLVFHSDDPDTDLFDLIISDIEAACENDRIPFLIRTGCLLGTGIDNVNIMEHPVVMGLTHPLVVFYPSKIENSNLYFLGFKLASNYRCILI